jgi:DNA-binding winged helix-turn-helix (wHTH) protein
MSAGAVTGYRFGPYVLNLDRACLQTDGADLELRPKAFDVLRLLVERAGRLVTKDELVSAVWPNVIVNDDALAQCVRDVRKALKDEREAYIRTVPRRGYMFVAETTPLDASPRKSNQADPTSDPGILRSRWLTGALALAALALVVLAAWSTGWFGGRPPQPDDRLTIAVLPFANLSADPSQSWLSDGIAEDTMTALSRFRDLTVIARNSSFRYRDATADPQTIGRELGADFLLQGSVSRAAVMIFGSVYSSSRRQPAAIAGQIVTTGPSPTCSPYEARSPMRSPLSWWLVPAAPQSSGCERNRRRSWRRMSWCCGRARPTSRSRSRRRRKRWR